MVDLLQEARGIGPSLASRSEQIEANRTLPDDVVADLKAAFCWRLQGLDITLGQAFFHLPLSPGDTLGTHWGHILHALGRNVQRLWQTVRDSK